MYNYLYQILNGELPQELISIIIHYLQPSQKKNLPWCVFCKGSVSYYEYIDGAGYVCSICTYGL